MKYILFKKCCSRSTTLQGANVGFAEEAVCIVEPFNANAYEKVEAFLC